MSYDFFISLVRLGIGHASPEDSIVPEIGDWDELKSLADEQGVKAVILDGLNLLELGKEVFPKKVKLQWIGEVIHGYEDRYYHHLQAIAKMARFFNKHGIKMMVLKGFTCSLDWPHPAHRPCGDIDIWQFGEQQRADEILTCEMGIQVDSSHHHHTVFYWDDIMVENHYDFINVHHHKSNASLEKVFKDLGRDDTHFVVVDGEKVYLPSPDLHALFLLRHSMSHFAATEITVRHLLDWAFFVQAHAPEVNWKWLLGALDQFGMTELFHIFNAICVNDLGFSAQLFPLASVDAELKQRVLQEMLDPAIPNRKPTGLIPRVVWKFCRWKGNGWKHRLCYNDSLWSAFWSGVWNHLLKPSSI